MLTFDACVDILSFKMKKKEANTKRQFANLALGKALTHAKDGPDLLRLLRMELRNTGNNDIQDDPQSTSSESDLN
jgi:hypothetical protein